MNKVIFGDFDEYNSPQVRLGNYHYCNCFRKDGYEILWMSNAFNQLIYLKDKHDYYFKKNISSPQRHPLAENVFGFAPYSWRLYGNYPFCRNPKILEHFQDYIVPNIKNSLQRMDFYDVDILWISNPKMYWLTNVVQYKKLVYRIADDYSQFREFPNINHINDTLIQKADTVVVASSELEPHVKACGKKPLLLSNGVEFEHFSQTDMGSPSEYRNGRKRIVYVGTLKYWFDTQLIAKIADKIDADIYLIGKCETDLSQLHKYENIFILGSRDYNMLPGYLKHADVALIPFIKSQATDAVSPIKLYEYCSAGVAVVSSNLAETVKQNAPIWIGNTHDSFIEGINYYLKSGYDRNELINFGRDNSWSKRYKELKKALNQ